ncbi:YTP1-like protein [Ophiocordyceps camponoti-floridani]|uniref:YTP1-like protein n=1 Tax=Ophiocordyceps camponoti-floridani TaxID=2030778 RepID=A0A8H4QA06_9HYPO|nr:YTP1-like protein [Ophiocordyceps camponoti-floridani]
MNIAEGESVSKEPIDTVLWVHIFVQSFAYGIVFPIGMVLGMTKSRWHVPTQIFGSVFAVLGFFLGHAHGGREFIGNNAHSGFATILQLLLVCQVVLGLYLKGHWERGINGRIRRFIRPCHSFIGKLMPVLSWTQMLFGGITALGFCQADHFGQCLAHFIMGSAFIAYGITLSLILVVGQLWIRRTGRSQEFYDSAVIAAWGCVNTFTEHRWGSAWVRNDWQHTTMGIIWWSAGLVGMWLSRDRDGNPKRNFVPGFVVFMTGWAMSAHPQSLMVSAMTHSMFGKTLMAVGLTRVIEIAFVLKDKQSLTDDGRSWNSFQFVPVFLMYAAGFLFMGATEEQMQLVDQSAVDHVSYILMLYSVAFIVFLFSNMLIHLYDRLANPVDNRELGLYDRLAEPAVESRALGTGNGNGHVSTERRLRDCDEFELDGLMSDDDGPSSRGLDSPSSTLGKNEATSVR